MGIYQEIAAKYPTLKRKLTIAHIEMTPEEYIKRNLINAITMGIVVTFAAALFIIGLELNPLLIPAAGIVATYGLFMLFMRSADVKIRKLAKEIDKDVLFAGRFLLIKLNSGKPLLNAIIDASNSYGVANKYFKEIVRDIELGTPLEEALDKASRYCPSEKMRRILFQISNALRIGVDVTDYLEAILDEIAEDQLIEIKSYGRKLSGITLFYMLFAVVIPSLGITMLITVISLIHIQADTGMFMLVLFMLIVIEFIFISIFKSIRPNVNI
jgi:pilus assembly protein TadC